MQYEMCGGSRRAHLAPATNVGSVCIRGDIYGDFNATRSGGRWALQFSSGCMLQVFNSKQPPAFQSISMQLYVPRQNDKQPPCLTD